MRVERYGSRFWAVYEFDRLVCVTVYRKGALEVGSDADVVVVWHVGFELEGIARAQLACEVAHRQPHLAARDHRLGRKRVVVHVPQRERRPLALQRFVVTLHQRLQGTDWVNLSD